MKPNSPYRDMPFEDMVALKRTKRMEAIDALPADIRELVHEYGYHVVNALLVNGIKKASVIRHIVETVLNEFSPTRGTYSNQGRRTEVSP